MPEGVIAGGWSYVIGAYSLTAVGLIAHAWSLWRRWRDVTERTPEDE